MQDTENKNKKNGTDDWMFDNPFMNKVATKGGGYKEMARPTSIIPEPVVETESETDIDPCDITVADCHKSLTPSALQAPGWRTETVFPCCPKEVIPDGLKEYEENLKPGLMFSSNQYGSYYVIDRAIHPKRNWLFVLSAKKDEDGGSGECSVAVVDIKFNKYLHISMSLFGNITDATKYYKALIGEYQLTEDEEIMYLDT